MKPSGSEIIRPRHAFFPSDISVPLPDDPDEDERWGRADANGSADAAFARALARYQKGDVGSAIPFLRRADERGSAEAAYLLGRIAIDEQGDVESAARAWQRAQRRGSVLAAFELAALGSDDGEDSARRARDSVLRSAEAADREGSADAALVAAMVHAGEGRTELALEAARRADDRGSVQGAVLLSQLALRGGDSGEAAQAALRAAQHGSAAGACILGAAYDNEGRYAQARRAWRWALRLAEAQEDDDVGEYAYARLHPGLRRWLRTHLVPISATAAISLLLLAVDGWPWLVVVAAWVATILARGWQVVIGTPITTSDSTEGEYDSLPSLSVGGLTLAAGSMRFPSSPGELSRPATREATPRDRRYLRLVPTLLALLATGATLWAAEIVTGAVAFRLLCVWYAVYHLWNVAWRFPDIVAAKPAPASAETTGSFGFLLRVPMPFSSLFGTSSSWRVRGVVGIPSLMGVQDMIHRHKVSDGPILRTLRRANKWLRVLTPVLLAAFLGTLAAVPEQRAFALAVWASFATILEIAIVVIIVVVSTERAVQAAVRRTFGGLIASVSYVLAAVVAVLLANRLGLLDGWVTVGEWLAERPFW